MLWPTHVCACVFDSTCSVCSCPCWRGVVRLCSCMLFATVATSDASVSLHTRTPIGTIYLRDK